MTLEWDTFKVLPDDIIVEMKTEDESDFMHVAKLKGKITQVLIENIDKTKRYTFRVIGRNESGSGEPAAVELTEPLYKEPPKIEKLAEVKEEVAIKKEVITEEVTEVTETSEHMIAYVTFYFLRISVLYQIIFCDSLHSCRTHTIETHYFMQFVC